MQKKDRPAVSHPSGEEKENFPKSLTPQDRVLSSKAQKQRVFRLGRRVAMSRVFAMRSRSVSVLKGVTARELMIGQASYDLHAFATSCGKLVSSSGGLPVVTGRARARPTPWGRLWTI